MGIVSYNNNIHTTNNPNNSTNPMKLGLYNLIPSITSREMGTLISIVDKNSSGFVTKGEWLNLFEFEDDTGLFDYNEVAGKLARNLQKSSGQFGHIKRTQLQSKKELNTHTENNEIITEVIDIDPLSHLNPLTTAIEIASETPTPGNGTENEDSEREIIH